MKNILKAFMILFSIIFLSSCFGNNSSSSSSNKTSSSSSSISSQTSTNSSSSTSVEPWSPTYTVYSNFPFEGFTTGLANPNGANCYLKVKSGNTITLKIHSGLWVYKSMSRNNNIITKDKEYQLLVDNNINIVVDYEKYRNGMEFVYNSDTNSYALSKAPIYNSADTIVDIPSVYNDDVHGLLPVEKINDEVFLNRIELTSIKWTDKMKIIGNSAFSGCKNLVTYGVMTNLTEIGDFAFEDCGLTEFKVPASLTKLGVGVFKGASITNFYSFNAKYSVDTYTVGSITAKILFDDDKSELVAYSSGVDEIAEYTIPATVDYIHPYAFTKADIKVVNVQDSATVSGKALLKKIDKYAFAYTQVTTMNLPYLLTEIDDYAFYGSKAITNVVPQNEIYLTKIGNSAFEQCINFQWFKASSIYSKDYTFPASVTAIGKRAFYQCHNLCNIIKLSHVSITIGSEAFYDSNLACLQIYGTTFTSIGSDAFKNSRLNSMQIFIDGSNIFDYFFVTDDIVYLAGSKGIGYIYTERYQTDDLPAIIGKINNINTTIAANSVIQNNYIAYSSLETHWDSSISQNVTDSTSYFYFAKKFYSGYYNPNYDDITDNFVRKHYNVSEDVEYYTYQG